MFFPKLRAHAKWVFVLLAVIFAGELRLPRRRLRLVGLSDLLQGNWGDLFGTTAGSRTQVNEG